MSRAPGGRIRRPEMESEESGQGTRTELKSFLEILTLTGFIVAQPVLDVFGKSPETFVFRGAGRTEIVLFAVLVTVIPAGVLWIVAASLGRLGPRMRRASQAVMIWLLLALLGIQVVKKLTPLIGVWLGLVGALIGVALTLTVLRFDVVRRWLRFAWPASIAFILIFLLLSSVSGLVLPQAAGRSAEGSAARVPVVMVIFDQLPLASLIDAEGRIDGDRFPNFARLSRTSTWYRNYTVTEPFTTYSVPTILTGQLARDRSKKVIAADYPNNLFTLLGKTHHLQVFSPIGSLCPEDLCPETNQGIEGEHQAVGALLKDAAGIWSDISLPGAVTRDVTAQFEEPTAAERQEHLRRHGVPLRFQTFLDSLRFGPRPGLHFAHVVFPHHPWRFFPSGVSYERPEGSDKAPLVPNSQPARWRNEPWLMELTRLRHTLQVQFVDRLVGRLIEQLEKAGLYEEAVVVVTSDHGHSFGPGRPRQAPTQQSLHEVMWVPLIIKEPHQVRGRIDDANIMAPDLLPTIADLLGVEVPWSTDGTSALAEDADRGPVKTFIRHRDGKRVPWPTGALAISIVDAWSRLKSESFQPATTSSDPSLLPYLVGPRPELIGKKVADLRSGDAVSLDVQLDAPRALDSVDLRSGVIPALISGTARGVSGGTNIAVAVNDRIAGVSPTFSRGGQQGAFQVLVPEFFFVEGANSLRLFTVEGEILHPLRGSTTS